MVWTFREIEINNSDKIDFRFIDKHCKASHEVCYQVFDNGDCSLNCGDSSMNSVNEQSLHLLYKTCLVLFSSLLQVKN